MGNGKGNGQEFERYEEKFADFIKLCDEAEPDTTVMIATPYALGDTYEEVIESLTRLANAELSLRIVSDSPFDL